MKKSTLFTLLFVVGLMSFAQAQNEDYRLNASISYNYTFTGELLKLAQEGAEITLNASDTQRKNIPSVQLAVDYGLNNWFSIGAAISYQQIGLNLDDVSYIDSTGMSVSENVESRFTRFSAAIRPLFHYANSDRLDMYSGLRIQYYAGNYEDNSENPDVETVLDFPTKKGFGVGIVAYGIRYFVTDNIGIGWELNIGRPYVTNISVNARF